MWSYLVKYPPPRNFLEQLLFFHNFFLSVAKTIDFCKAQYSIKLAINQITNLRSEQAFSDLHKQLIRFCEHHHIDLSVTPRSRRTKTISTRFKDVFITSSVGQRDVINNEDKYRTDLYYPRIDSMLIELNDHFSQKIWKF